MAHPNTAQPAPAPAYATLGAALATLATLVPGTVCVLATANPKAPGSRSAARFACYKPGISVAAYKAACAALAPVQPNVKRNAQADLAWDTRHGFINIVPQRAH